MKNRTFRWLASFLLPMLILYATSGGWAATLIWTNTAGGDWANATNWSPNQVPTGTDNAYITNNATFTVSMFNIVYAVSNLTLGGISGTNTLDIAGALDINGACVGNTHAVVENFDNQQPDLAGGYLNGTGTLSLAGPLLWQASQPGGVIDGAVNPNITLSFITTTNAQLCYAVGSPYSGPVGFTGSNWVNTGTMIICFGPLVLGPNTSLSNAPGATVFFTTTFDNINNVTPNNGLGGTGTFLNAGQLLVSDLYGQDFIQPQFINTGTIVLTNSTTLTLSGGGTNLNTATIWGGSTLEATNGYEFNPESTVTGPGTLSVYQGASVDGLVNCAQFYVDYGQYNQHPGTVNITGTIAAETSSFAGSATFTNAATLTSAMLIGNGTISFNGTGAIQPTAITLIGGTLAGSDPVVAAGPLNWMGGTISGIVQCAGGTIVNGITEIPNTCYLLGGELINDGVMTVQNTEFDPNFATFATGDGSVVSNTPSGTFNFIGYVAGTSLVAGPSAFINAGLVTWTNSPVLNQYDTGPAQMTLDSLINSGTVSVLACSNYVMQLTLANGGTNAGSLTLGTNSSLSFANGTFVFTAGSQFTEPGAFTFLGDTGYFNGVGYIGGPATFPSGTVTVGGYWGMTNAMILDGGTFNVSGNGGFSAASVALSSGTLALNGTGSCVAGTANFTGGTDAGTQALQVRNSGGFTWSSGNIYGEVLANGGSITAPDSSVVGYGGVFINTGPLTWTPNDIRTGQGAIISNTLSGVITIALNGNDIADNAYGGASAFYNAGQINISGAGQTGALNEPFFSSGTVTITNGTFSLADGGTNTGTINAASGADLDFGGGTFTSTPGSVITGAGNLSDSLNGTYTFAGAMNLAGAWNFVANATVNLTGTTTTSGNAINFSYNGNGAVVNFNGTGNGGAWRPGTINLFGGTIAGTTPVLVSGPLNWSGGSIYGLVQANGGSVSAPDSSVVGNGGEWINTGPLTWTPNYLRTGQGTIISNAPSGVITITLNNNDIVDYAYGGVVAFYNAGQINISGAGLTGAITTPFFNSGAVTITNGTLSLAGGGTNTATITAASGADLDFGGGTFTSTAGSLIAGTGNFSDSNSGTYTFAGAMNLSGAWNLNANATVNLTGSSTTSGNTINFNVNDNGAVVNFNGTGNGGMWRPGAINLYAGTIAGTTPVLVSGPLNWSGGNIYGLVQANGGSVSAPASSEVGNGGEWINSGPLAWTPNNLRTGQGTIISNAPGGVITIALNNNDIVDYAYGGVVAFYNAGQIKVSGAGLAGAITTPFLNTGTVTITNGTFELGGTDTNSGTIAVQAAATFNPNGGTFTSVGTVSGAGVLTVSYGAVNFAGNGALSVSTVNLSGGTVNFNGTGAYQPGTLNFSGGTLAGTTPVLVGGPLNWSGGNIYGLVQANGGSVSAPSSSVVGYGGEWVNTGPLAWTPNNLRTGQGTIFSNSPSGVITIALNNNDIVDDAYGGACAFYNAGQINISGAGLAGTITTPLFNTGTVTITNGSFGLGGGGTNNGAITPQTAGTFNLSGGTFTSLGAISGAGGLTVSGGTANLGGNVSVNGTNTFSGGTVTLTGSSTASGYTATVSGGTVSYYGTGPYRPGILNLTAGTLGGTNLVLVSGPLNWSGGNIYGVVQADGGSVSAPASSVVGYGGEWINTGPLAWTPNNLRTGQGTIISNAPAGVITIALNNNDIVDDAYGGTVAFYNAGQINVSGAGVAGAITTPFFNTGIINIHSGTLALGGGVSLTNGTLDFGIASPTSFASLNVSGNVALTGSLGVTFNGYTPQTGDAFGLVTYGSKTGTFSGFNLPGAVTWNEAYGPTLFTLAVASLAPTVVSLVPNHPLWTTNGFNLLVSGPVGSNYVIQASTNLARGNWATFTNFVSTTIQSPIFDIRATNYFTNRFYRAMMY